MNPNSQISSQIPKSVEKTEIGQGLPSHFTYSRPRLPCLSLIVTRRDRSAVRGQYGHLVISTGPNCGHREWEAEVELDIDRSPCRTAGEEGGSEAATVGMWLGWICAATALFCAASCGSRVMTWICGGSGPAGRHAVAELDKLWTPHPNLTANDDPSRVSHCSYLDRQRVSHASYVSEQRRSASKSAQRCRIWAIHPKKNMCVFLLQNSYYLKLDVLYLSSKKSLRFICIHPYLKTIKILTLK
jgi:hypothetical protein